PLMLRCDRNVSIVIFSTESNRAEKRRRFIPLPGRSETREAIAKQWKDAPEHVGIGGPPRIVCAIILVGRGELQAARRLSAAQAQETRYPGHSAYVRGLAEKLGLGSLGPRLQV